MSIIALRIFLVNFTVGLASPRMLEAAELIDRHVKALLKCVPCGVETPVASMPIDTGAQDCRPDSAMRSTVPPLGRHRRTRSQRTASPFAANEASRANTMFGRHDAILNATKDGRLAAQKRLTRVPPRLQVERAQTNQGHLLRNGLPSPTTPKALPQRPKSRAAVSLPKTSSRGVAILRRIREVRHAHSIICIGTLSAITACPHVLRAKVHTDSISGARLRAHTGLER